jgi:hydrogenase/urease accessory protein HupE
MPGYAVDFEFGGRTGRRPVVCVTPPRTHSVLVTFALHTGLTCSVASAHQFEITEVVVLLKSNHAYVIDMTVDVDALALGVSPAVDSALLAERLRGLTPGEFANCVEFARETLANRVRIRFDGQKQVPSIGFPDDAASAAGVSGLPTVLGITARFSGRIPPDAKEFTFGASRSFNVVHLTIFDQSSLAAARYVLDVSEDSPPYRIGGGDGRADRTRIAWDYLVLGFEHILPKGPDHILFVLGLFLLSTRIRPLVWQITAFTIAHSITLALSMFDIVSLPFRFVESMIALSIACVAVENIVTSELKPWRPVVVFLFGLLHGLGFAGVLRELGLPREEFVTAVLTFNIGVEIGQLSVVLITFVAIGWFRRAAWYRSRIVIPLSAGIALVGLYWCAERALR